MALGRESRYRSTGAVPNSGGFSGANWGGGQIKEKGVTYINTYQVLAKLAPETPPSFATTQDDCKSGVIHLFVMVPPRKAILYVTTPLGG